MRSNGLTEFVTDDDCAIVNCPGLEIVTVQAHNWEFVMYALITSLLAAAITFSAPLASAEFVATGNLEGWVCNGFVIELCAYKPIKNTLTPEGLRVLPKQFPETRVFEYNQKIGRCFVDTNGVTFVTFTDEVIEPDHVGFSCVKR